MARPPDARALLNRARDLHGRWPLRVVWLVGVPLGAVALLDPHLNLIGSPALCLLNALPVILCALLLLALTRRVALSGLVAAGLAAVVFAANRIKLRELQDVIVPHDLRLVGQVLTHAEFFARYAEVGALAVVLGGLGLVGLGGLFRYEPALRGLTTGRRLPLGAAAACLGVALAYPVTPLGQLYAPDALPSDPRPTASARQIGLIATFLKVTGSMQVGLPDYDAEVALAHFGLQAPAARAVPRTGRPPDLVVVMAESFFDPSILNGVERVPQLDAFYRMREGAVSGQLAVPAGAGGGTMRTEFEFLTGVALHHLSAHPYPYYSLVRASFPSLPRLLKGTGYEALALHPHRPTFWNRNVAYPNLGFDAFHSEGTFPKHRDGFFLSDSVLVDRIISLLDDEAPRFIFAVSIEGHGPWTRRPVADPARRDAIGVPEALSEQDVTAFRNVLYHLENTSEALLRLHDFIQARETPTALLVFGDHLPYPGTVYQTLGFENGRTEAEQAVPFLIAANYPIAPGHVDTCAHFLGGLLLDVAGVEVGGEFAWNAHLRRAADGLTPASGRLLCALPSDLAADQHHLQTAWMALAWGGDRLLRAALDRP